VVGADHVDRNHRNNRIANLALIHEHCHDEVYRSVHDKHLATEDLDDGKTITSGFEDESVGRLTGLVELESPAFRPGSMSIRVSEGVWVISSDRLTCSVCLAPPKFLA